MPFRKGLMTENGDMFKSIRERGYDARSLSVSHLDAVKEDVEGLYRKGSLAEELYREYLFRFKYFVPESFPEAKSLIVVSVPQPTCEVSFNVRGRRFRTIVPPTYAKAVDVDMEIMDALERGDGDGVRLMRAILPHKTLAARTGLVRYGRNNITYAPGCGSFHRLTSFFTDRELPDDWQEARMMDLCSDCDACVRACPTRAIDEDRFLMHAERCITFHNEMPSERGFPDYVLEGMHNAVVGCMICQKVCPANAKLDNWMVHCTEFDEDDTSYLMKGDFSGPRAKRMAAMLEPLGLELQFFPRNLVALMERAQRSYGETFEHQ